MTKEDKAKRIGLISLGCPKNLVDSELMLGQLRQEGCEIVDPLARADTVIVNTCGFIDDAKQESVETILEVAARKQRGEIDRLVVAGCMVNRYGRELADEIPEIDGFVDLDQLGEVGNVVRLGSAAPSAAVPAHRVFDHQAPRVVTTQGHAYLKVAEGCDNPCTFCAIPSWRGNFRSRTIDSLVAEAQTLEENGTVELCLIAQDTTRYGEDLGYGRLGLLRLVEALLEGTKVPWIRFHYAYPTTLHNELIDLMGAEPRFLSYLDIPLQHSHPEVLTRMRRGGSAERFLRLLERARASDPQIFLRSTFIVGFPGETPEQFEHLLHFVEQADLDHVGAFGYSPEPGTPAAELDARVPARVIEERYNRLLECQREVALGRRQRLLGERIEVLVEGPHPETEHLLRARHQGQAPEIDGHVLINDGVAPAGRFVEVEVTDAYPDDLVAHIVGPPDVDEIVLGAGPVLSDTPQLTEVR